jgi:hypothetical protein
MTIKEHKAWWMVRRELAHELDGTVITASFHTSPLHTKQALEVIDLDRKTAQANDTTPAGWRLTYRLFATQQPLNTADVAAAAIRRIVEAAQKQTAARLDLQKALIDARSVPGITLVDPVIDMNGNYAVSVRGPAIEHDDGEGA